MAASSKDVFTIALPTTGAECVLTITFLVPMLLPIAFDWHHWDWRPRQLCNLRLGGAASVDWHLPFLKYTCFLPLQGSQVNLIIFPIGFGMIESEVPS